MIFHLEMNKEKFGENRRENEDFVSEFAETVVQVGNAHVMYCDVRFQGENGRTERFYSKS
jgi:hypothetical protein